MGEQVIKHLQNFIGLNGKVCSLADNVSLKLRK